MVIAVACRECPTLVEPPAAVCDSCASILAERVQRYQATSGEAKRFVVVGAAVAHYAPPDMDYFAPRRYVMALCGREFEWGRCKRATTEPLCGNCARVTA